MQMLQVVEHLRRGLVPQVRVRLHGLVDDPAELAAVLPRLQRNHIGSMVNRAHAGNQVIQRRPQAVDIRAHIQEDGARLVLIRTVTGLAGRGGVLPVFLRKKSRPLVLIGALFQGNGFQGLGF